ncbi:glycoside hydrolase family 3 C-terminal domain-containing protein [Eubacterium sp.]|uniref:glycoside hydrolase family 3 C-terminal domain-containing protein n=1 Tax=Eubacterium sp. TaxID=142586 RepID=UPI003F078354
MNLQSKTKHFEIGESLAQKLTVTELISQLMHYSKGINRLDIKPYVWWNEALHGVARAGIATVFPQAICMAASFDEKLLFDVAEVISTEARAKYNESQKNKDYGIYKGLTMWSPNINIFRDPRWGRGQETYGEDPYLTSILGAAFILGLQGDDPEYIKTAACAKHFAVHSGPEESRHSFNAIVSKKDMFETYLPAFKKAVKDAGVCGIMGAYNCVNGEACCASDALIQKLLRESWGFNGYFVSDCGAVADIVYNHKLTKNPLKGAAMALNAGCDLECGKLYRLLHLSYAKKYITKDTLLQSVSRLLAIRSSLGMFDNSCKYNNIPPSQNAIEQHGELSVRVGEQGIVLLENNGILPLKRNEQKILIVGYNAENDLAYLGNYCGTPKYFCKVTQAVKGFNSDTEYVQGYSYNIKENDALQAQAVEKAKNADLILFCSGLDCSFEGEEAGELLKGGGGMLGKQGDRQSLELPDVQQRLLKNLFSLNKKVIVLNFSGGCVDLRYCKEKADAVLQCWYPGAMGGKAIANILFGDTSPSGKLPITFYNSVDDLPDFENYSMKNRTYRYFSGPVQYPFGYGITYTSFNLTSYSLKGNNLICTVKNTGDTDCYETLQLYMTCPEADYENPIRSLIKIERFYLPAGKEKEINIALQDSDFYSVNESGDTVYLCGGYDLYLSDGQSINCNVGCYVNEKESVIIEKCPI